MSMATLHAGRAQESLRVGHPFPELKGRSLWKKRLAYYAEHKDDAYLIVIDRKGVVRWLHHGGFDQSRADDLHALLLSLADRESTGADDHLAPRTVEP